MHGARGRSRLLRMAKGALATLDDDAIIDRISSGEIMRTIAAELGVAKQSLRERLISHPQYPQAIAAQAESMVEQAVAEIMDPDLPADAPVIARARARVDAAFRYAAARDPARWGNRPDAGQPSILINVVRAAGVPVEVTVGSQSVTIDATPVADTPAQHSLPKP